MLGPIREVSTSIYRVSRQVLDSLIECDNPIGLWWVWVAYPKTTIPYQDGCLNNHQNQTIFKKTQLIVTALIIIHSWF